MSFSSLVLPAPWQLHVALRLDPGQERPVKRGAVQAGFFPVCRARVGNPGKESMALEGGEHSW